jgi:hypothetical protein
VISVHLPESVIEVLGLLVGEGDSAEMHSVSPARRRADGKYEKALAERIARVTQNEYGFAHENVTERTVFVLRATRIRSSIE